MSKFWRTLSALVLVSVMPMMAQQFPDSGFENWTGAQFAGSEQPKYWNYSNVSQLGVDKNYAHKTTGRSGYALKIQNQFVGVGGIGATSPGYVTLGHPWSYISGMSGINEASGGVHGGISWNYRPDSLVVWVRRYYDSGVEQAAGDHTTEENFSILYYAWTGTSKGESYKAKNGTCTNIASVAPQYCVDEESDVRQALDANECGTKEFAKQIAEGWLYQKKRYNNWTRIVVPIYYMSDEAPAKCNVILSPGHYPDFRASTGIYAGNSLDVDDIHLIYSSKIQKLYIGGREWKGFDPNNTGEQTYSLGVGVTAIPEISAVRGAGTLTNTRGGRATFQGRRLSSSECTIQYGQVDGEPTLVTVSAEDGSSTTTYRIKFVSQASNNARLSDIRVNGESLSGFNAYLTSYDVALPYGTTEAPVVTATLQDASATMVITQASSTTGTASIAVTAGDGTTKQTYTLHFSVAALTDVTLKNIFVNGAPLPGFQPSKSNYSVSLPLGTTEAPTITWESAYAAGVQTINLLNNTLEGGAQIQVSLPNTSLSKTYKLNYKIEASSYSYLAGIYLDGAPLEGFEPEKISYAITLPMGTTALPSITWTKGEEHQRVTMTEGGVEGTTRIEVVAPSGATTTYRLAFRTEKSTNNALSSILIGGEALADFDPEVLNYHVLLPAGTTGMPEVTYIPGDSYQQVAVTVNAALMTVRLTVTAGDGSTRMYTLSMEVEKSADALLQMIYLNGDSLSGFVPEQLNYSLVWNEATMPVVTVSGQEGQTVAIAMPSTYGTARIEVTPDEGTSITYTVTLVSPDAASLPPFPIDSFPVSHDASLSALYIGGQPYASFKPTTFSYIYNKLPAHTYEVPAVVPVAATKGQTITVSHGALNSWTTIQVVAADGVSTQTYKILFRATRSGNTSLASVEIDGVDNFVFDPAVMTYTDLLLPYGMTQSPSLTVERAESTQSLVITEAPIGQPSTILVTAENGKQATYTFTYRVGYSNKANELLGIVVDGVGALDMTKGPDFTIDLPYSMDSLKVISVAKNYPEQKVIIIEGGVSNPTKIIVKSLNPDEADKVYTITPHRPTLDPAQLLDIQVAGTSISQFKSDGYSYVVSVASTPEVTYTAPEGAEVDVDANEKYVKLTVEAEDGKYKHVYLVSFFYPGDITFDMTFDRYDNVTNNAVDESAYCPQGWYSPIRATTENTASWNTYYPENNQSRTEDHTQGNYAAVLKTAFLTTSAESMPGIFSLSPQSVYIGRWILGIGGISSSSTLSFGDPIKFRNSPDNVKMDYNLRSKSKISKWSFLFMINGESNKYEEAFTADRTWKTMSLPIAYSDDFIPSALEIRINSGDYETPAAYNVNSLTESDGYLSEMWVDNMRFEYSSALNGITVNGVAATRSGNAFTATVAADYKGLPNIVLQHAVYDQMPVVTWSEEVNRVRTATIRNYAEDLSYTDYTLTVTRPKSTNVSCTCSLNGRDLTVIKGSPYQTIDVQAYNNNQDTAYVVTVTAETGKQKSYTLLWRSATNMETARVTKVLAENVISAESTARLVNLETTPVLNYNREFAFDSVAMLMTDSAYELRVFGISTDTTYIIDRHASSNALLESMQANGQMIPGFNSENYDYSVSLSSLDSFSAEAQDSTAVVQYIILPIDASYYAIYVLVTAGDSKTQSRYSVLAHIHPLSSEAYLTAIQADGVMLNGFASDQYNYTISLPAHSAIPQLSSVACAGAEVETTTTPDGSSATVTFSVTSEDGSVTRIYTVQVKVAPSDICTLSDLYVNGVAVEGFAAEQTTYTVELPRGASAPDVYYVLTDKTSKAVLAQDASSVTITVTAEDGIHTTVYTIALTYAKSTNANLQAIYLNGTPLADFFVDEHSYTITLPFGTAIPVVTADAEDSAATVSVSEDGTTITVTAEDGKTKKVYTLSFTFLPSTNANLQAIYLDGVLQYGFAPDTYEYKDTVRFGSPMPVVTWTLGDEQQVVDTTWVGDTELSIAVTAGDGLATAEYILTFEHLLSSNCRLADLQVRGTTVEGFHPDTIVYTFTYPAGTPSTALFEQADVTAVTEDEEATATIMMDENATAQILVTAPDGTRRVYVIYQHIIRSSEARLRMIWLDADTLRRYEMDTLHYEIVLPQGAIMPVITAEPLDTLATWELGMPVETESGTTVDVYGIAEDGTMLTYSLSFTFANWAPSAEVDPDDYFFFYLGDGRYKAVTIGIGVQFAVYDMAGRIVMLQELPTADPSDVEVEVQADGNQILRWATPDANGAVFHAQAGQPYFYVFFDSKTKHVAKGGKFEWRN